MTTESHSLPRVDPFVRLRVILGCLIGWIFTIVYTFGLLLACILTLRVWSRELVAPASRFWARTILALLGVRVILDNPSTLEDRKSRIVLFNHSSTLDPAWVSIVMPPAGIPVGKREFIYYPGFNLAWWALRFELIDRSSPKNAQRTLQKLVEKIQAEKLSVIMAPEGTRSVDGAMHPFKKGAFHMAMNAGISLYPVIGRGVHQIWPRGRWLPTPGVIHIQFLEPIPTTDWNRRNLNERVEEVRAKMQRALDQPID